MKRPSRRVERAHTPALLLTALTASAVLAGCDVRRSDAPWVRPDALAELSWSKEDAPREAEAQTIWRGNGWALSGRGVEGVERLRARRNETTKLVMVTILAGTRLARELRNDPLTLAYVPPTESRAGAALVEVPDASLHAALAAAAHREARHACGAVEVLDLLTVADSAPITEPVFAEPVQLPTVKTLTDGVQQENLETTIKALEAMGTRRQFTESGKAAPAAIKTMLEDAATGIPGVSVALREHTGTEQNSVVLTIPAKDDAAGTGPVVIVGAHLDSINDGEGIVGDAPGADDDGSGIATLVELVRVLASAKATFARTVEVHAYAAEEDGLVGSGEIARDYAAKGRKVAAMFQLDMNGWASTPGDDTIYLVTNDTQEPLRRSALALGFNYLGGGVVEGTLKGGTSDHRSWTRAGFPAVFPFENPIDYNEALHSTADTFTTINSMGLANRMTQLAVAFVAHHAGLGGGKADYAASVESFRSATPKDITFAIEAAGGDQFQLHVSVPAAVSTVELCAAPEGGPLTCSNARVPLMALEDASGRHFFAYPSLIALSEGMRFGAYGLDADGKLVAHRAIKLAKK